MSEWISIKDRTPDEPGYYLIYAPTYNEDYELTRPKECHDGVMFSRWPRQGNCFTIENGGYFRRPGCVTHWMPLPLPPKGE